MATDPTDVRPDSAFRGVLGVGISLAGVAAGMTMLWLGMRAVMDIGGVCAGGAQPFPISRPCPKGVALVVFAGIWGGLIFAGIYVWQTIKHRVPSFVWLFWPALFISLGYNFLQYGIDPPGGGGLVTGWLICGVLFVVMGGVPLLLVLPSMLRHFRYAPDDRQSQNLTKLGMVRDALAMMPAFRAAQKSWKTGDNVEDILRRVAEATGAGGTSATGAYPTAGYATPDPAAASGQPEDLVSSLERLEALHRTGALSDQEYADAKARVLREKGS